MGRKRARRGSIVVGYFQRGGKVRPITRQRPRTSKLGRPLRAKDFHDSTSHKGIYGRGERGNINLSEPWEVNWAVKSCKIQPRRP